MPLSWNEIRARSVTFVREWDGESSEHAEAKSFWDAFFHVFGVSRRRVAAFEQHVKKADGKDGYIDLFWPGMLLAEHKSLGKDLDSAFDQATDYFPGLSDKELPRYIIVSDFARFRIRNLDTDEHVETLLTDLPKNLSLFGFIAGYETREYKEQDPVNTKAAYKLAELHDALKNIGYEGHDLEVYLVRTLFCLFAEDTGIFMPRGAFEEFIRYRTSEDGSDLAPRLNQIFQTLNTPEDKRLRNLDEQVASLPYVNGKLFEEHLPQASFDSSMRKVLLECCDLDWGVISPAIFGSLFQGIMDAEVRRNLGAHYTSEQNIQKVIGPLFMDDLWEEFRRIKSQKSKLEAFHEKLGKLSFFDPACGCGNFLVISYREIRLLELEVIKQLHSKEQQQLSMDAIDKYVKVDVDQFHGIEIEEWPAQIARVAMWLIDHQMNLLVGQTFGQTLVRIPLVKSANVLHANALRLDWEDVVSSSECSFLFGNPPFLGKQFQSEEQKADLTNLYGNAKGAKELDLVAAWYVKAARYINETTRCAFVSTNSISQGEQVSLLWRQLKSHGIHIHFAHRTFRWRNEARGVAAVHCVIIGFGKAVHPVPQIFDYHDIVGEPQKTLAKRINPYLVDAPDVLIESRRTAICDVPPIVFGSMPNDKGNLLLTDEEKIDLLASEPGAEKWIYPFTGAREFLNGVTRWCLWLKDLPPEELKNLPRIRSRVDAVRTYRLNSKRKATNKLADTPSLFGENRQPSTSYLIIPSASSQRRPFIPIAMQDPDIIASNLCLLIAGASSFHLGVLSSTMHMAWVRTVAGRLKSDYRYANEIVYNNFPWPIDSTDKHKGAISTAARGILDARAQFPDSTLADIYDPLSMPPALVKAHKTLDRAVDGAYMPSGGKRTWPTEAERVAFLFELHQKITSLLPTEKPKRIGRRKAAST